MTLAELGEFGLIHRIAPNFEISSSDYMGIGDDCAVLPQDAHRVWLVTTDLLIEDIHFLRERISPEDLGHKSLAVNLSDIAAMGGTPTAAFLSVGLPKTIEIEWLDRFFSGIRDLAQATNCLLLGGDTTKSKQGVVINFTILGNAWRRNLKYRSYAKPGDIIAVTGMLGDSGAGLQLLLNNISVDDEPKRYLVDAHHRPAPHLAEGAWLAQRTGVHAMLDVSDGIDSDLHRIMEASQIGATVDLEALPLSDHMRTTCQAFSWNAHEIAVAGGEDYCLLCTIDPQKFARIAKEYQNTFNKPLYDIGVITDTNQLVYKQDKQTVQFTKHGFDHFTG